MPNINFKNSQRPALVVRGGRHCPDRKRIGGRSRGAGAGGRARGVREANGGDWQDGSRSPLAARAGPFRRGPRR